jgi:RHS repeat-associated protein
VPDVVSGGQPATASGVTWTGSGAQLTGQPGQKITTAGPAVDTTGSFSVSAWVNLTAVTGSDEQVISQDAGSMSGFYLGINGGSSNWGFARPQEDQNDPPDWAVSAGPTAHTGTWTFLTGVFNASAGTVQLYVNGTASASASDPAPIPARGPLEIGAEKWDGQAGTGNFNGSIAGVQVYPTALSAAEVGSLYGQGRTTGGDITRDALTTTWTRDQRGLPTSMTNPDGNVTNYSYDEAGQLAVTTGPPVTARTYGNPVVTARPVTTVGYDTFGDNAEDKDPNGNVTTTAYDADGQPVSRTLPPYTPPGGSSPVTATATTAYDADGRVTSVSDGLNNTTRYGYDQLGDKVTVTAPDNSVTTTAYDAEGEPLSVTGPTGAVTDFTYDYLGRRATSTQVERYAGSGTAAYTTTYAYGDASGAAGGGGWLAQQTSPAGVSTRYSYDPSGAVTAVTDGAQNTTSYSYDGLGRKTKVTYPDGTATTAGYDPAGNTVSTANLSATGTTLASTSAAFNGEGGQVSATDAAGNSTTFTFDPTGLVSGEVQPVTGSSGITTSFGYDPAGNRTLYTDPNGSQWWDTYNSWGLQESRVEPYTIAYSTAANSTFTTAYDAAGRPVSETEPGGVTVTSTYNSLSELTGQSATGADAASPTRTFGYDTAGNLTSAATSNTAGSGSNATSETFTYNDRGQVLTASGSGGSTSYAYNGDGRATSVADAAGTTAYSYDGAGRLATLADPATGTTATYSYNPDSQVSQVSYGSGKDTRSFAYDGQRRLTSDTLKTSSGTTVASVSYGYNADSEITSQNTTGLAGAASNTYTYDQAGRLTSWNNGTATVQYGYDPNGNLTQNGAKTYSYDARDEMTSDGANSYSYTARGTPSSESGLTGTIAVSFDAYGDQATAGTRSYAYDALGRLTADTPTAGGGGYQFSYAGATGTIASDGTSAYTWDPSGSSLVGTGSPGGGTGGVLALANAHGDVLGQFTAAGTAVAGSQAYDPWGKVTTTTGTPQGLLGYQSAWSDPASGKDLMGARWYAPAEGHFTSADTVQVSPDPDPAAGNPFAYASDEPLNVTDPTGHWGWNPISAVVSIAKKTVAVAKKTVAVVKKTVAVVQKKVAVVAHAVRNVTVRVADAARTVVRATAYVVTHPVAAVKAAVKAVKAIPIVKKAVSALKTAGKALKAAGAVVKKAAVSAGRFVQKAAASTGRFVVKHAAAIGGAAAGFAAFAGCEAVTVGAGSLGCAALSGAVSSAVSYGITAAQTGKFSWSGLGKATLTGAAEGLAFGGLGKALGAAKGLFADDASSLADSAAGEARAPAREESAGSEDGGGSGGTCRVGGGALGGQSFTAGTLVLLASGKAVPISTLKVGDKVLADNTRTGKDQSETVTAVLVHHDTDLYNLTVKTTSGTEVIHTTASHLFWDPYLHYWVPAGKLKKGERLKTPDGSLAVADGGTTPKVHHGWMWDLTVPGNNDHDFYVLPADGDRSTYYRADRGGVTPILVHNVGCGPDNETLATRAEAKAAAYDRAGIAPGTEPDAVWTVGDDVTQRGMPGYRYDENPGAHGNYEQFETENGSRVIAEHTNDPDAPFSHFHAGQPKIDPTREGVNFGWDPSTDFERYSPVGGKHHIYYESSG